MLALAGLARGAAAGALVDVLKARQTKLDELYARSGGAPTVAEKEALGKTLAEAIHFPSMGKAALAAQFETMTEAQRAGYLEAFEGLVRANFLRKVELYKADSVAYADESVGEKEGSVKTSIRSKSATTEVVYSFARLDGKWRVVDYTIDGVSAVANYRSQFTKLAEKRGVDGLIERLKKRKAEIEAGS